MGSIVGEFGYRLEKQSVVLMWGGMDRRKRSDEREKKRQKTEAQEVWKASSVFALPRVILFMCVACV